MAKYRKKPVVISAGQWGGSNLGEVEREWHNLDTQIGDEWEKANKEGKVLNHAILTVS